MKRLQAYKFRLKTTPRIERLFAQFAGCCRYVYNRALAMNEERRAKGEKRLNYFALAKLLTAWRADEETAWLADSSVYAQQQALMNLERGYVNFFQGRAGAPRFKKKGKSVDAFGMALDLRNRPFVDAKMNRLRLPKVGWVRYFNSRAIEGTPKNVTVSKRAGHWYVNIQTEREVAEPVHSHPESAIGLDAGIVSLATLSNGEKIPSINAFRSIEKRLRRLQRRMSRKVKFSANWKKAKEKVAKLHFNAANRRNDHLHKLTTRLSKSHATIVVENLPVKDMTRSAKGTVEKPCKNVKQKAGLNKSIRDQGWSEMIRQLTYKAAWSGGCVVKVNPAFTSQTCHRCGCRDAANRPSQSRFVCLWCGLEENADVNAARVILAVGQTVMACGGVSGTGGDTGEAMPR